ncbi:hypothetical protein [Granulicella aggregans]|jgi:hypothetical protein|uniref:hypothetical protein n=1 Tax=Granulicella aggregans TaxID=474949 RepID=UPI0021DF7353|nr:hypothetical protein [Granulicella aggregans]
MRKRISGIFLCVTAAALAFPTLGQLARTRPTIPRSPYTAHYKITRTQKLSDGNVIRNESTEISAVDSQGRQMTATTGALPFGGDSLRTTIFVFDPIARTHTVWSSPGHQVTVGSMPEPGASRICTASSTDADPNTKGVRSERPKPVFEALGTDTIQGIEARGRRITTTYPAGEIGNQYPLVTTSEVWTATAPALSGMIVRETSDDPRTGTRSKELVSYEQGDPDAAIFQPPASYEIVKNTTETSCTTQTISAPQQ